MNIIRLIKRTHELGPQGIAQTLSRRLSKKVFAQKYKTKALQQKAGSGWHDLKHNYSLNSFENFFGQLTANNMVDTIWTSPTFQTYLPKDYTNKKSIQKYAQQTINNTYDVLGSGPTSHADIIPWHQDIKCKNNNFFEQLRNTFYQDIVIPAPNNVRHDEYHPDIKVPWELSRMQHLIWLGLQRDEQCVQTFIKQVDSWIEHNPFLLGVNWVCPMDVAIRAVNLIWCFHFFKNEQEISADFWQKLICSLHDHALYLEHNWETSDKPNNHYLADLVGYLYLCHFFKPIQQFQKKLTWIQKKVIHEFNKQILPDGTCWEGTTAYHQLDTEMVLHACLLDNYVHDNLWPITEHMIGFLEDCGKVHIGDDDSGKLVAGITAKPSNNITKTYAHFGLSIIKKAGWEISFRHPTFNQKQPTGHFHHDELAVTLSINGQPILVDPGSYLYTANPTWRNDFRLAHNHNTLHVVAGNNKYENLFQLTRATNTTKQSVIQTNQGVIVGDSYIHNQTKLDRSITFAPQKNKLMICDNIDHPLSSPTKISWTFLFHPDVTLTPVDHFTWSATVSNTIKVFIHSTMPFSKMQSFFAPAYGIKMPCSKLVGSITVRNNQQHTLTVGTTLKVPLHDQSDHY